jgi:transposase
MARSKTGEAIGPAGRTPAARKKLRRFIAAASQRSDLAAWKRGRAVLGYIQGTSVIVLAEQLDVTRGAINRWLQWYEVEGVGGLATKKAPGPAPKLTDGQRAVLAYMIEMGPQAAGYTSGVWTGPMIGDLIAQKFDVRYHNHHVPRLLNDLGFSVQRPRKRLARADAEAQDLWLRTRLPAIKKKPLLAAES